MLPKFYFLIFSQFIIVASSDDYILDFVYVDIPTTTATTTAATTVVETTTAVTTIVTYTPDTMIEVTSSKVSLYDPRNQFNNIEVDFEAKRRENERARYENTGIEASGSQIGNESDLSDVEVIEPMNVPLVSRNDRENEIAKKNAAEDLDRINESFQKAFDQMFGTDTKFKPKNIKKVRKTQT